MDKHKQDNSSDLSRRDFLVQSAGFAGASMGLSATRASDPAGACSEVRLGFIGLGDRGRQLLGAALSSSKARVTALCDLDPAKLKRARQMAGTEGGPRGFTNYRALLDSKDVLSLIHI